MTLVSFLKPFTSPQVMKIFHICDLLKVLQFYVLHLDLWSILICSLYLSQRLLFLLTGDQLLQYHLFIFLFCFVFWPCRMACKILVPRPMIEPVPPAVEARSLNHWTAREVPPMPFVERTIHSPPTRLYLCTYWSHLCASISGHSIPFHWSMCPLICLDYCLDDCSFMLS